MKPSKRINLMRKHINLLFSILMGVVCAAAVAADKPNCKKTGKNCPMNDNKDCNCVVEKCGCAKREHPGNKSSK
jgi:hypothetical protein